MATKLDRLLRRECEVKSEMMTVAARRENLSDSLVQFLERELNSDLEAVRKAVQREIELGGIYTG